ncbi:MAG: hypothetical protein DME97_09100 [Verrucomicrobia bacterium]|nr:MAG: hypothetical protein DME97_09100 [Verrucomicrobiota bacterium]
MTDTDRSAIEANHPAIAANRATRGINRSTIIMTGPATDPNRRAPDTNRLKTGTDLSTMGMNRRVMHIFQFTEDICRPTIHIHREIIDAGQQTICAHQGATDQSCGEGNCLGESSGGRWAISPAGSNEILSLQFETEFALLVDLSADPRRN